MRPSGYQHELCSHEPLGWHSSSTPYWLCHPGLGISLCLPFPSPSNKNNIVLTTG